MFRGIRAGAGHRPGSGPCGETIVTPEVFNSGKDRTA